MRRYWRGMKTGFGFADDYDAMHDATLTNLKLTVMLLILTAVLRLVNDLTQ